MNWRFFYRPNWGPEWGFRACNEKQGFLFRSDGSSYYGRHPIAFCCLAEIASNRENIEISFGHAISRLTEEGRENVLQLLDCPIENFESVVLTQEIIKKYVDILKENKAFNGDSAHKFEKSEWPILNSMQKEKIILKSPLDDSYYLGPNHKQIVLDFKEEKIDKSG